MADEPTNVLLIEDNPADAGLIRELLDEYRLTCVDRLSEGLERLDAGGVDVVLLDLSLPDSQGVETFVRARDLAPGVPIVVLTGTDDGDLALEVLRKGAQDYLVKGRVDENTLVSALNHAVERHRMFVELERQKREIQAGESRLRVQRDLFSREQKRATQKFEELVRDLSVVRRIGDSLRYTRDVRKVFEVIIDTIMAETNAENCSIMLLNQETGELTVKAAMGQKDPSIKYYTTTGGSSRSFRLGEGIAGWVAQEGAPIFIPDISRDKRFLGDSNGSDSIGSLLCLPLVIDSEVVGVVNMSHPKPNAISDEDERLMDIITGQVAITLNNVRVFDDMNQLNNLLKEEVHKATEELQKANAELIAEIAERKKAQKALQEAERMRVLAETARAAAHEIFQPLSVVIGHSDLLLGATSPDHPQHTPIKILRSKKFGRRDRRFVRS